MADEEAMRTKVSANSVKKNNEHFKYLENHDKHIHLQKTFKSN